MGPNKDYKMGFIGWTWGVSSLRMGQMRSVQNVTISRTLTFNLCVAVSNCQSQHKTGGGAFNMCQKRSRTITIHTGCFCAVPYFFFYFSAKHELFLFSSTGIINPDSAHQEVHWMLEAERDRS